MIATCYSTVSGLLMPDLRRHGYLEGDGEVEANTGLKARRRTFA